MDGGVIAEMGRLGSKWFGRESPELSFGQAKFEIPPVPPGGEGEWAVGHQRRDKDFIWEREFMDGSYSREAGYPPRKGYKQPSWGGETAQEEGSGGEGGEPAGHRACLSRGGRGLERCRGMGGCGLDGVGVRQGVSAEWWGRPDSRAGSEGVDVASGDASGAVWLGRAAGAGAVGGGEC